MKVWLYLGLGGALSFALLLISVVGINPKPVKLIKPSQFKNTSEMAYSIYKRLFPEIKENHNFQLVYLEEPKFKEIWDQLKVLILNQDSNKDVELLSLTDYLKTQSTSELISNQNVETSNIKKPSLILFQGRFGRDPKEMDEIKIYCPEYFNNNEFMTVEQISLIQDLALRLDCMALSVSRSARKKDYSQEKWVAAAEQLGALRYVLFISPSHVP